MTVAVAVKVFDGIVLAADSATTLPLKGGAQVWNGANKVFHLHRKKPIAAMTWGLGAIGSASISTLAKELRLRLMGLDSKHKDWKLGEDFTVKGVADRLVEMFFDELYAPLQAAGALGFLVAGFSGDSSGSEAWIVTFENASLRPVPECAAAVDQSGWMAYAQAAAIQRLFNGWDDRLLTELKTSLEFPHDSAAEQILHSQKLQPAHPAMPLFDAIQLAGFMVDVTGGYTRFLLGPDTVGGPTEVAAITRHEGFKWISRKHYYDPRLNPGDPGHDAYQQLDDPRD